MNRLHHIAIGSPDVQRLAAFYRDFVGLTELRRQSFEDGSLRSVWLDLGGALLMIEKTEAVLRHVDGIGSGPFLIAFTVTPAERAALERKLEVTFGVEARTEFTSYSRDPDGNRVAFSHYPESLTGGERA